MKTNRHCFFFAALVAAGALTFLLALARQGRNMIFMPYSPPEGGEREGEFELFIGS